MKRRVRDGKSGVNYGKCGGGGVLSKGEMYYYGAGIWSTGGVV